MVLLTRIDVLSDINDNAKYIIDAEGKDIKEAIYLSICLLLDFAKQEKMNSLHQLICTDLLDNELKEYCADVMLYISWRDKDYYGIIFKSDVEKMMYKVHRSNSRPFFLLISL